MWVGQDSGRVYSADYHSILLHAISRDEGAFPHACLYCQISGDVPSHVIPPSLSVVGQHVNGPPDDDEAGEMDTDEDEPSDEDADEKMVEIRFVPRQDSDACTLMSYNLCSP